VKMRSGGGMIGILLTIGILGIVVAMSMKTVGTTNTLSTTSTTPGASSVVTTSTVPIVSAAQRAGCVSNIQLITTAIGAFDALNSSDPIARETRIAPGIPGTYPHGAQASRLIAASLVSSWPSSNAYSISLSRTSAGQLSLYIPATNPRPSTGPPSVACQRL